MLHVTSKSKYICIRITIHVYIYIIKQRLEVIWKKIVEILGITIMTRNQTLD